MSKAPLTIHLDPDSELARALANAHAGPIQLNANGARFLVVPVRNDLWADYDPDAVLAGLQKAAGSLSREEGERMKALIYRGREVGTRPRTRP